MTTLINRLRRRQKGFTLIELLVVVAIIALLATFAVPKLFDAINKSKKAPGQADMQTISGALDRYYMDNSTGLATYPTGDSDAVTGELANGFLKGSTTYMNGYKQPYLYAVNDDGSGYILIDMQGVKLAAGAHDVALACGVTFVDVDTATSLVVTEVDPVAIDLTTCTAPAGMALVSN